jgi:hypothetical protein
MSDLLFFLVNICLPSSAYIERILLVTVVLLFYPFFSFKLCCNREDDFNPKRFYQLLVASLQFVSFQEVSKQVCFSLILTEFASPFLLLHCIEW